MERRIGYFLARAQGAMPLLLAAALLLLPATVLARVTDDAIVLGAAVSLTGRYTTAGHHTRNGYDLAVKMVNERGGVVVAGTAYRLEILYYDDESTPARGAQLAERLIRQDGIRFMLGPYSSGLTTAIAPITEQHKVPMVEGNGASRALFNKGYRYLFAVLSTSEQYLQEAINLAAEQAAAGARDPATLRVAVATANDPFSQDIRAGVLDDARRHGMRVVIDDKLPREANDMAATLLKVKALRPDVLLVSGHSKGAALLVRQAEEMRASAPMVAMTHCESARVTDAEQFGHAAEGILCAAQWAPTLTYRDGLFGSAADYAVRFEEEYGYVPPYQAAESTAAVMVWADALERAGSFDTETVRAALAATDMQTFYGNIRFDQTGKNIAKPMVLLQIQDGEYRVVAPTAWASDDLAFPRPGSAPVPETVAARSGPLLLQSGSLSVQILLDGLLVGAIFVLAAYGMALVWGVMNIINVSQGELVILGGYVTWLLSSLGVHPLLGIPVSGAVLFLVGWALYRAVVFRLVDRDLFVSLLATFGLTIVLQQVMNQVFGADLRTANAGLGSTFLLGDRVVLGNVKLVAFAVTLVTAGLLVLFLRRSRAGRAIRATAQNARAARLVGVRTDRVYALAFALNAALCGVAGALVAMVWVIHPFIGITYTVRSFMIVVLAGLGNVAGVAVAGTALGVAENFAGFSLGVEFQTAFVFSLLVVILLVRSYLLSRRRQVLR
ncbi:MAG: ABC transporter substrate-binding protein [Spirochaetaceae bacterium]|nr:ABC transporter substrate-binding protein [Spirochaetaceae bacterium]